VDVHVRVARSVVLLDLLDELVGVISKYELVLEFVCVAALDELLEVLRQRQLLRRRSFDERVRPDLERDLLCLVLGARVTGCDLAIPSACPCPRRRRTP
jgi:hypothetical protein